MKIHLSDGEWKLMDRLWEDGPATITQLAHALQIDPASWHLTKAREPGSVSDPPGTWRPVSGDARWRVDHWRRRS